MPNKLIADKLGISQTTVRMIKRLVSLMQERKWGRVIAIASGVGTKPMPAMPAYFATKVANINLAVSLAMALTDSCVTSNAVSPDIIMTQGVEDMFDSMGIEKKYRNS